jgi:cytochrome c-type biogenesis protein CcmH
MARKRSHVRVTISTEVEERSVINQPLWRWVIAATVVLALAVGGVAAWRNLAPPSQSAVAPATAPAAPVDPALVQQAAEIQEKLRAAPADAALWQGLARTHVLLGEFDKAVAAYKSAIANGADGAPVQSAFGEAQVMAANGQVTQQALAAFQAALAKDTAEPRARYYLALADAQGGKLYDALDQWIALEADSPASAPWRKSLTERIDQTANALGLDPHKLPGRGGAEPADEPSGADLAAAARRPAAERAALLGEKTRVLAARLSHEPGNLQDWRRLGQAYKLLGDFEQSLVAWKQAATLAPDDEEILGRYAEAMLAVQGEGQKLPPEFAQLAQRIRTLDPKSLEGMFFDALTQQDAGNKDGARELWEEILRGLPAESPQRTDIQRRLDDLNAGG